jgi:hypothetical protein
MKVEIWSDVAAPGVIDEARAVLSSDAYADEVLSHEMIGMESSALENTRKVM